MITKLEIVLLNPIAMPEQHGDWIDLKIVRDEYFEVPGEYRRISLGVKVNIWFGYEAHILPRSSTFEKHGLLLVNSMGIVDYTYGDEWNFLGVSTREVLIPAGTRIAQFRLIERMKPVEITIVESLPTHFTRQGIGSTGN